MLTQSGVKNYKGPRSVTFHYRLPTSTLGISCTCRPSDFHFEVSSFDKFIKICKRILH